MAKHLDTALLNDLVRFGYVYPEQQLKQRRITSSRQSKGKRTGSSQTLFKAKRVLAPPPRGSLVIPKQVSGTVLLMRVRRASATGRRTQVQIPIRVVRTNFFLGIKRLTSAHDGRVHDLISASARGGLNTIKVEIPEIDPMTDPVLRLERRATAIVYQAFDFNSVLGSPIGQALMNGFNVSPPTSFSSKSDLNKATWWRFI